jgi:Tol biopolymer transport system component
MTHFRHVLSNASMTRLLAFSLLLCTVFATACIDTVAPQPDTSIYDLVYESTDSPASNQSQLYKRRAGDTTRTSVLGANVFAASPDVSADGRRLVYMAPSSTTGDFALFIAGSDGTGAHLLYSSTTATLSSPALSPDGSRVAFVKHFAPERSEIWVVDSDGTNEQRVTVAPEGQTLIHAYPAWSPFGQALAFSMGTPGNLHIAATSVAGGAITHVTETTASDVEPSWSPDGSSIVYARTSTPAQSDLHVVDGSGRDVALLVNRNARTPAWSPKGDAIAFSGRNAGEATELFALRLQSGAVEQITHSDVYERHPNWMRRLQ